MRSRWSEEEAVGFVAKYGLKWGEPLALRTYSSRLLGAEPQLVLHGGGNSSVKTVWTDIMKREVPALFVKASGVDMATIEPEDHPGLDLSYLRRLRGLTELDDETMVDQLRTHLFRADSRTPSIEALVHAFLPGIYVDHTHADAILALTNREGGEKAVREALGDDVIVLPYVTPGFKLALASWAAVKAQPGAWGMVWAHHGLVTWGDTARDSYEMMISLVSRAEKYLAASRAKPAPGRTKAAAEAKAQPGFDAHQAEVAPILRGLLAPARGIPIVRTARWCFSSPRAPRSSRRSACPARVRPSSGHRSRPTTSSAPRRCLCGWRNPRTATRPLCGSNSRRRWTNIAAEYEAYLDRHAEEMPKGVEPFDPLPRVVLLPGLGIFGAGPDLRDAVIALEIAEHTLAVKTSILSAGGTYEGLPEDELFRMEYRTLQHAKLAQPAAAAPSLPLRGHVALVTGAAGAIGTGICQGLLEAGCLVAATDLAGPPLQSLVGTLEVAFPGRVVAVPLDVTDPDSVSAAFDIIARLWGGVDLVIPNAGIAMVATLADLTLERYRKLEQVNVEGTLLVLAEAGRRFKKQAHRR